MVLSCNPWIVEICSPLTAPHGVSARRVWSSLELVLVLGPEPWKETKTLKTRVTNLVTWAHIWAHIPQGKA